MCEDHRAPRFCRGDKQATGCRERLANLEAYAGDVKLMPPWPSDAANCVVCHASRAEVSEASLYRK